MGWAMRAEVGGIFPGVLSQHSHIVARCGCGRTSFPRADSWAVKRGCKSCSHKRPSPLRQPDAGLKWLLLNYKNSAARRGFAFELGAERFRALTGANCHYCGAAPAAISRPDTHAPYTYNGIDRVNPRAGYVEGNVVSCCATCNAMKGVLDFADFLARVRAIGVKWQ